VFGEGTVRRRGARHGDRGTRRPMRDGRGCAIRRLARVAWLSRSRWDRLGRRAVAHRTDTVWAGPFNNLVWAFLTCESRIHDGPRLRFSSRSFFSFSFCEALFFFSFDRVLTAHCGGDRSISVSRLANCTTTASDDFPLESTNRFTAQMQCINLFDHLLRKVSRCKMCTSKFQA
jgi:hypothetical protein